MSKRFISNKKYTLSANEVLNKINSGYIKKELTFSDLKKINYKVEEIKYEIFTTMDIAMKYAQRIAKYLKLDLRETFPHKGFHGYETEGVYVFQNATYAYGQKINPKSNEFVVSILGMAFDMQDIANYFRYHIPVRCCTCNKIIEEEDNNINNNDRKSYLAFNKFNRICRDCDTILYQANEPSLPRSLEDKELATQLLAEAIETIKLYT